MLKAWRQRVRVLKRDTYALYLAYRDPRVPWYARLFAACVVAYAFSPFDLIPDFIPVLGYLDDLLLVPLGLVLAVRMVPAEVMRECRERADARLAGPRPTNWAAGAVIVCVWLAAAALTAWLVAGVVGEWR